MTSTPKIPFYLFNTETREKELFTPLRDNHVKMYTCGPTIYNFAHIGNFRTYIFEDILKRALKFFGFQVTQVMNITDVDDKTIKGATEKGISLNDFTRPFLEAFFKDIETLGIEKAEKYPAATDYIPQMITFIQKLIQEGVAYQSHDKSIYFSIRKCPRYGRLSHLKLDELEAGAGETCVASDEYEKDNISDFVLWKAYDPTRDGKIYWESPFGPGRPGWHLECSAMAIELLGETIDIHAGAVDNIFPHHENEIAQSECMTHKMFSRFWVHSEHLLVNHKKMSKSLGNFYTLRDLIEKGYLGKEVRYMLLNSHYRTQLNFTLEGLEGARATLNRLNDFIGRLQEKAATKGQKTSFCEELLEKTRLEFSKALADDLNMSAALAALFDLMRDINSYSDKGEMTGEDAFQVLILLKDVDKVLNVFTFEREERAPKEVEELLVKRNQARKEKNFQLADTCRAQIHDHGYVIEDTPTGARLKKR